MEMIEHDVHVFAIGDALHSHPGSKQLFCAQNVSADEKVGHAFHCRSHEHGHHAAIFGNPVHASGIPLDGAAAKLVDKYFCR